MFRPSVLRCWTTQSMAAITWETSTAPSGAATFMLSRRAPGAMPTKLRFEPCSSDFGSSPTDGSRPAMMPAMCVPCPNWSTPGAASPEPNERSGPFTMPSVELRQRRDAGVDHRDVDTGAGVAVLPHPVGADVLRDLVHRARDLLRVVHRRVERDVDTGGDRDHAGDRLDRGELVAGEPGHVPVEDLQRLVRITAESPNRQRDTGLGPRLDPNQRVDRRHGRAGRRDRRPADREREQHCEQCRRAAGDARPSRVPRRFEPCASSHFLHLCRSVDGGFAIDSSPAQATIYRPTDLRPSLRPLLSGQTPVTAGPRPRLSGSHQITKVGDGPCRRSEGSTPCARAAVRLLRRPARPGSGHGRNAWRQVTRRRRGVPGPLRVSPSDHPATPAENPTGDGATERRRRTSCSTSSTPARGQTSANSSPP